jgi:hypothetical protein
VPPRPRLAMADEAGPDSVDNVPWQDVFLINDVAAS